MQEVYIIKLLVNIRIMINPIEITKAKINDKRTQRNFALRDSDVYMIIDYPINDYQRDLIKTYRQSLRDYFQKPEVINWTFTLENQELPPLPSFPDYAEASASASLKFIEVPMDAEASESAVPMDTEASESAVSMDAEANESAVLMEVEKINI